MRDAEWFIIASGPHAGRLHMAGWIGTAIHAAPMSRYPDGRPREYLAASVCPRCRALVLADDDDAVRDQTWAHEEWHAMTDYPPPQGLRR